MPFELNTQQQKTLAKICDTFNPEIPPDENDNSAIFANSSSDYDVAHHLIRRFESLPNSEFHRISKLLKLMDIPFACWMVTGNRQPFSKLNVSERAKILHRWCGSRNQNIRTFFQSAKRISLFFSYASHRPPEKNALKNDVSMDADAMHRPNPTWHSIGYSGINPLTNQSAIDNEEFQPVEVDRGTELECDVLVIGSGAGGSVVASRLAEAGIDTLICEKGFMPQRSQLGFGEFEGNKRLFDKHGALSTPDLSIVILAGQTVGGGTTVNWMTSLETPASVREEWARDFGFAEAVNRSFDQSLVAIKSRLGVNQQPDIHNRQNEILKAGCQQLGYRTSVIPRNAIECRDCGFCGYGCRGNGKRDTRRTFLADAISNGAGIVVGVAVERILRRHGQIAGVDVNVTDANGNHFSRFVRCKNIVLAAGSIHSPAILLRSGFSNANLGKNLHLHPTTAVAAVHDSPVRAWEGPPQTIVCDHFENSQGDGYGYRLEVAPLHPGFAAMALAWESPQQHKRLMTQFENIANTIVLTRDKSSGSVTLDTEGDPKIHYRIGQAERKMLIDGSVEALKVQLAAGAKKLIGPLQQYIGWSNQAFETESVRQQITKRSKSANSFALFSAHQLSSCRMASSPKHGVCDPTGKVYECDGLFVADGSLLPTSTGVNPMISIMTVANMVANSMV